MIGGCNHFPQAYKSARMGLLKRLAAHVLLCTNLPKRFVLEIVAKYGFTHARRELRNLLA